MFKIRTMNAISEHGTAALIKRGCEVGPKVENPDALLIRTRTRCNAAMLGGTSVRVIASAAISTDNIDLDYCRESGIFVSNASGSNAGGVMNYVGWRRASPSNSTAGLSAS